MMRLFADVGNTRIKWACADDEWPGVQSAMAHDGDPRAALDRVVDGLHDRPDEIVLVDVTGDVDAARFVIPVRFVEPVASFAGVRNAYTDPSQLGADRWAALIAAKARSGDATCIVDCGSAVTLDLLDGDGVHLGGAIAPGHALQCMALSQGTARIDAIANPTEGIGWGRNTAAAVAAGTRLAVAGFVASGLAEAQRILGPGMQVLLTGGDVEMVRAHVAMPHETVPDLVLQGAWRWAETA